MSETLSLKVDVPYVLPHEELIEVLRTAVLPNEVVQVLALAVTLHRYVITDPEGNPASVAALREGVWAALKGPIFGTPPAITGAEVSLYHVNDVGLAWRLPAKSFPKTHRVY